MGYVMGKAEGRGENWHGHVSAVTVAPPFRRMGLAKKMMDELESIGEKVHDGYFVDLAVRKSNSNAIAMYEGLGYTVYREVLDYYSGEENAYDMRKALPRDVKKRSIVPLRGRCTLGNSERTSRDDARAPRRGGGDCSD